MKKLIGCIIAIIALMSFQPSPKKTVPAKSKPVAILPPPVTGMKATMDRGKLIYLKQCLACHQVDGGGVPHLNAPLDAATQVVNNNKERLIKIVLKGMTESVELDGEYYSNKMAPHTDLTDQEIADVLTYVRNSWTNKASAVTPAEVKAVRLKIK
ncbi:MAG: cytochrome c [Bacteroidota bacterium]